MKNLFKLLILLFVIACQDKVEVKKEFKSSEIPVKNVTYNCFDDYIGLKNFKENNNRTNVLMHAKATPVIFLDEPKYKETTNKKIALYRKLINSDKNAWGNILKFLPQFKNNPKFGREVVLKDGYLYTENSNVAYALTQMININHLFNDEFVFLQRGNIILTVKKTKNGYVFADGPFKDEHVTLMLYDRLFTDIPENTLHIDLRDVFYKYQPDNIDLLKYSHKYMLVNLHYKNHIIKAIIDLETNDIKCQEGNKDIDIGFISDLIRKRKKRLAGVQNIRKAIINQVSDRIPFDEPIREYGLQLDGALRPQWEKAFFNREYRFKYNSDYYQVYNKLGKPIPPQVCVDFLIDTLDRAAGTWYTDSTNIKYPARNIGSFNSKDHGKYLRNITSFIKFANNNPNWFEVIDVKDTIQFKEDNFYEYLYSQKHQPGDIILIKGKTSWDKRNIHYHSFFIFENDPLTGYPVLIAGNAGPAAIRSWEIEKRRTPERYIYKIIKIKQNLLDLLTVNDSVNLSPYIIR